MKISKDSLLPWKLVGFLMTSVFLQPGMTDNVVWNRTPAGSLPEMWLPVRHLWLLSRQGSPVFKVTAEAVGLFDCSWYFCWIPNKTRNVVGWQPLSALLRILYSFYLWHLLAFVWVLSLVGLLAMPSTFIPCVYCGRCPPWPPWPCKAHAPAVASVVLVYRTASDSLLSQRCCWVSRHEVIPGHRQILEEEIWLDILD